MSAESEGSITYLLSRFNSGDRAAADGIVQHFLPRLLGLARKTLAGRPQRFADAEDAVQSALLSFWRQVERHELQGPLDQDDLWNLLGLITVRKALKQSGRESAQKRGGGHVIREADLAGQTRENQPVFRLDETLGRVPTQEFDLYCEELLLQLGDDLRPFALLKLLGYTTAEIADRLGCTRRKVQRKLALIGLRWERDLCE